MIRYVLAVLLTVAILGIAAIGVDEVATVRGDAEVTSAIATVDEAATSLFDQQVPGDGQAGPQRVVEIDLPVDGYAQSSPERLEFERVDDANATQVTYQFDGGAERTAVIRAPLTNEGRESFELSGYTGTHTLRLELRTDVEGRPIIDTTVDP